MLVHYHTGRQTRAPAVQQTWPIKRFPDLYHIILYFTFRKFKVPDLLLSLGVQPPGPGLPQRPQLRLAAWQCAAGDLGPRPEAGADRPRRAGRPRAPQDARHSPLQVTQRQNCAGGDGRW